MIKKESKKGFTLVELLAVIVILSVVILIAVTAVIPRMNNAKKKALVDEALIYLNAAKEAYSFDPELVNASSCTNITDLNGKYVKKDSDQYKGAVKTTINDGVVSQTIYLTDGKYYVSGTDNVSPSNVADEKPSIFFESCGDYNPILDENADTNTLAYSIIDKSLTHGGFQYNLDRINSGQANYIGRAEDDLGTSFYFIGNPEKNIVLFGGMCWSIVRINGDGSVRLMYESEGLGGGACSSWHNGAEPINSNPVKYIEPKTYNIETEDVSGLSSSKISLSFTQYADGPQYSGYMYDPTDTYMIYPQNLSDFTINNFFGYININSSSFFDIYDSTYFFRSNSIQDDCSNTTSDGNGYCILSCSNNQQDCKFSTLDEVIKDNLNYTSDSVNSWFYKFTSPLKYFCLDGSNSNPPTTIVNSNNTTSVYKPCRYVGELLGSAGSIGFDIYIRIHYFTPETRELISSNKVDSNAKKLVDIWYENNIYNKKDESNENYLEDYIDDGIFCSDRSSTTTYPYSSSWSGWTYQFKSVSRNSSGNVTFKCSNIGEDGFTLGDYGVSRANPKMIGNMKLKYPVGLITMDEARYAGVQKSQPSSTYYNYLTMSMNDKSIFTMTPSEYRYITHDGYLSNVWTFGNKYDSNHILYWSPYVKNIQMSGSDSVSTNINSAYLRPVINIKYNVNVKSGYGTFDHPYTLTLPTT